jgi:hypothetical protein
MKSVEIVYRYEAQDAPAAPRPADADAARRLNEGNRAFGALLDGLTDEGGPARRVVQEEGPAAAWLAPLFFLGSIQFAFYARASNVDVHALFWLWLAVELVERAASWRRLALGAAAAALAVCCKEQAGPMSAVLVAAAAWKALRGPSGPLAGRAVRALGVVLAAGLAYALVWQLPWNLGGWQAHHRFLFESALGSRSFPATPAGFAALAWQCVQYLPLAFGWPVLAGLALALALRASWRGLGLRALCSAVFLAGFIGRVGYVFPRFLLPVLVLAVPLAARGVRAALRALRVRRGVAWGLTAGVALTSITGTPLLTGLMLADPRLPAERWLEQNVPPGATVEVAGNGHINLRVPHRYRLERVTAKTLMAAPRGPIGDFVVIGTIDTMLLRRDPQLRALWWDAVRAFRSAGALVAAIAGNHDSAERVSAANGITDIGGVYVRGGYGQASSVDVLEFPDGPLALVTTPFLEPRMAPSAFVAGLGLVGGEEDAAAPDGPGADPGGSAGPRPLARGPAEGFDSSCAATFAIGSMAQNSSQAAAASIWLR